MAASSFVVVQSSRAQDSSSADSAVSNLSGSWQMTWAGPNGNQRQVTMQIKQDGKKLSGTLQGERGSAPLKGTCEGNQVSFSMKMRKRQVSFTGTVSGNKMSGTTEQGASWSATRQ
jgi:hypothetical protein